MAFCGKCGTQVNEGTKFCPACGANVDAGAAIEEAQSVQQTPVQPNGQQQAQPADPAQDAQQNKTMAILAYIIFFIPLLTGDHKKSAFVKFHANQGTVLFLAAVAFGIVYGILNAILTSLLFSVGGFGIWSILTTILGLLWLAPTVLCVMGIVHAVKGEMKPLPVIGKFQIIK